MVIKFITNYPAALITDKKILVISDIHIGLESELGSAGVRIHKQIEKFQEILYKLIELTDAKTLVILGDVKHKVPGATMQELRDIPKFLQNLSSKVKVIITKGNHDDYLETMVPTGVKIYGSKGFKIGKYGFFHGHAKPGKTLLKCDQLFIGHLQPSVEFRDGFGYATRQQVWLKGKLNPDVVKKLYKTKSTGKMNIIIVPSFNSMIGSMNVISTEDLLGPLLVNEMVQLDTMRTYLLDGTYLGLLSSIKEQI